MILYIELPDSPMSEVACNRLADMMVREARDFRDNKRLAATYWKMYLELRACCMTQGRAAP